MLRLLMPVDGSEGSDKAARYVASLGAHTDSLRVHVVNVQPRMNAWEVARFLKPEEVGLWQRQCGEDQMLSARGILAAAGVDHTAEIVSGGLPDAIVEYSRANGCDLIVMGTRGLGPVEGLLLGSVTAGVLKHSGIPVTLIR